MAGSEEQSQKRINQPDIKGAENKHSGPDEAIDAELQQRVVQRGTRAAPTVGAAAPPGRCLPHAATLQAAAAAGHWRTEPPAACPRPTCAAGVGGQSVRPC